MKTKRRFAIAGIVLGALLTLGPACGLLGTVFGMTRAFHTLGKSGVADPRVLADSIGMTLLAPFMGLVLLFAGLILLVLSLVFYFRLQAPSAG